MVEEPDANKFVILIKLEDAYISRNWEYIVQYDGLSGSGSTHIAGYKLKHINSVNIFIVNCTLELLASGHVWSSGHTCSCVIGRGKNWLMGWCEEILTWGKQLITGHRVGNLLINLGHSEGGIRK